MTDGARVSVVIPAYNAAWCVGRAIDSVLAQSSPPFEIIVVDDGSTDALDEALARFGSRIRVVAKPNGGLSSARNAGIHAAQGEWVAFLDADDWWLPAKLERQVDVFARHPDAVFCSTAARVVDPESQPIGEWRCGGDAASALEGIFAQNAYVAGSGSAVVARRDALVAAGGFDESLKSLEDIDMWMRLAARGEFRCVPEPLTVIVKRPGSMSRDLDVMRNAAIEVMTKNRHLLPPPKRGAFWRRAYAAMLTDYAKWEHREGRTREAVRHLAEVLLTAPFGRGRLALGLLAAIVLGKRF